MIFKELRDVGGDRVEFRRDGDDIWAQVILHNAVPIGPFTRDEIVDVLAGVAEGEDTMTDREKHLEEAITEWRVRAEELTKEVKDLKIELARVENLRDWWMDRALKPGKDVADGEADQDASAEDWRDAWHVRDRDGSIWVRQPNTHKWICVEFNGIYVSLGEVLYESELDNFGPITIINDLD